MNTQTLNSSIEYHLNGRGPTTTINTGGFSFAPQPPTPSAAQPTVSLEEENEDLRERIKELEADVAHQRGLAETALYVCNQYRAQLRDTAGAQAEVTKMKRQQTRYRNRVANGVIELAKAV